MPLIAKFPRGTLFPMPLNVTVPVPELRMRFCVVGVVPSSKLLNVMLPLLVAPDVVRVVVG